MRYVLLLLLVLFTLTLTSCSFNVDFVVVNNSDRPVQVRCKVSYFPGDFVDKIGPLSTMNAAQLRNGSREWRTLSKSEYQTNLENRMVTVSVMPGDALLVKRLPDGVVRDGELTYFFAVDEIIVMGAYGEFRFQGRQVPQAFVEETDRLYTLSYK